jgi:hypothetical protein
VTDLPVACTLDPATLKTRRDGLLRELVRHAEHRAEHTLGYRLRFAASEDALTLIVRAINAERLCCRFLTFTLTIEPDEGPIHLDLTGPPGTREFLSALLDD